MERESVRVSLLFDGFQQAHTRFLATMRGVDRDATPVDRDATLIPVFEALNCAVSLDDRLQGIRNRTNPSKFWSDGFFNGDTARGVRFARNRVHHQWADALSFSPDSKWGLRPLGEWIWRPQLPAGRDNKFESEYRDRLAAKPVSFTLRELSLCFADTRDVLWWNGEQQ